MTEHFLRLKWMPKDESELLAAYQGGLLEERNWCDLKADQAPGPKPNAELARDMASFAVDGGTLIIGLDEKEPGGSPLTPVDLSKVTPERIEQVASMKVDPPLTVECAVLEAAAAGSGYVLVHVPSSPLAPHQVEGKYLGRGDKTKRYLSDAEVALLIRRRDQWTAGAQQILTEFMAADPFPAGTGVYPHLLIVGQPVSHNAEMCRDLVRGSDFAVRAPNLINRVTSGNRLRDMLGAAYPGNAPAPELRHLVGGAFKTADGVVMTVTGARPGTGPDDERFVQQMEIREDGGLRYYSSHVGDPSQTLNGVQFTGLFIERVLTTFREVLEVCLELSAVHNFAGMWHFSVGVTNLRDARAAPTPNPYSWGFRAPHNYTADDYQQTSSATVREIEAHPARLTERILGRLFRGMADGEPSAFADPA